VIHDTIVSQAIRSFEPARQFQSLFPNAEHSIVQAKRDIQPDGWQPVSEWNSRCRLHDRYVVWLAVAVSVGADGVVTALEKQQVFVMEVDKVKRGRDERGGASWEVNFVELEDSQWEQLLRNGGNFAAIELEMETDAPVDRFDIFWRDTSPNRPRAFTDGIALKSPLRCMT
jgi:hypothetical protein